MFSDWQPNVQGEQGYRVEYANLDSSLFEALASAVLALPVQVEEPD